MAGRLLSFREKQKELVYQSFDYDFYSKYEPTQSEQQFANIVKSYLENFALTNIAFTDLMEKELESAGYYYNTSYTIEDVEYYLLEEV